MPSVEKYTLDEIPTLVMQLDTGDTVTIAIYDRDGTAVALATNACTEAPGSSGSFYYLLNFTVPPVFGKHSYKYKMTGTNQIEWGLFDWDGDLGIFDGAIHCDTINGTDDTDYPYGSNAFPCKTEANIKTLLARWTTVKEIHLTGSITLTQSYAGYRFVGASIGLATVALAGQNVAETRFDEVTISGAMNGAIHGHEIVLDAITDAEGQVFDALLDTNLSIKAGGELRVSRGQCLGSAIIDIDMQGTGVLAMVGFTARFNLKNMTNIGCVAVIYSEGTVAIDVSCTAGIYVAGHAVQTADNSTSLSQKIIQTVQALTIDELLASHVIAGSVGAALADLLTDVAAVPDDQEIRDAMKLAPTAGAPAAGSVDQHLDDIEADTTDIQARIPAALVGGAMDSDVSNMQAGVVSPAAVATDAIDADALATDAVNEIRDSILDDATRFSGADIDQALSTTESNIRGADADDLKDISDELAAVQADTDDIQTRLPAALVGGAMDSDVSVIQAAALTAINTQLAVTSGHGVGAWDATAAALTAQQVRDAMKLAPTGGAPAAGSVDTHLDDIEADTSAIDTRLPSDPADESLQQASHAQTQADIAALENLSQAQAQAAATAALNAYDPPTKAELDATEANLTAEHNQTQADIAALENLSQAQAEAACDAALVSYDPPTKAELDAAEAALTAEHAQTQADIAALNNLAAVDILTVKQTYAFDKAGDALAGLLWLEAGDGSIVTPTSVSVSVRDVDNTVLFTMTDAGPDAQGFFKVTQAAPGFTSGFVFKAVATMQVPVVGPLTSGYGMFTVG